MKYLLAALAAIMLGESRSQAAIIQGLADVVSVSTTHPDTNYSANTEAWIGDGYRTLVHLTFPTLETGEAGVFNLYLRCDATVLDPWVFSISVIQSYDRTTVTSNTVQPIQPLNTYSATLEPDIPGWGIYTFRANPSGYLAAGENELYISILNSAMVREAYQVSATVETLPIPEPGNLALAAIAVIGGLVRRRR